MSLAQIPIEEVKFNIFDTKSRNFELSVHNSLQTVKNFYARPEVETAVDTGVAIAGFVPFIAQLSAFVPIIRKNLEEETDWKIAFSQAIAHETRREITEDNIRSMYSNLNSISDKIPILDPTNETSLPLQDKKNIATILHTLIDTMINNFAQPEALYKKYPLIGVPPLIELALLVALLAPILNTLIPIIAKHPEISCKMRDILLDYRSLTIRVRLEKISTRSYIIDDVLQRVRNKPYNEYGYNETNSGILECDKNCEKPYFDASSVCLMDEYNVDSYYIPNYMHFTCMENYGLLVRHRVEQVFPVTLLNKLCKETPKKPTGIFM